MQILIGVGDYFDWVPAEADYVPTEEEVLRMDYKESVGGTWLKKTVIENKSETFVSIPDSQIDVLFDHFERVGTPKSRNRIVADFLEEKIAPGHAYPSSWTKITVDSDADLESYLNKRFEIALEDTNE